MSTVPFWKWKCFAWPSDNDSISAENFVFLELPRHLFLGTDDCSQEFVISKYWIVLRFVLSKVSVISEANNLWKYKGPEQNQLTMFNTNLLNWYLSKREIYSPIL